MCCCIWLDTKYTLTTANNNKKETITTTHHDHETAGATTNQTACAASTNTHGCGHYSQTNNTTALASLVVMVAVATKQVIPLPI